MGDGREGRRERERESVRATPGGRKEGGHETVVFNTHPHSDAPSTHDARTHAKPTGAEMFASPPSPRKKKKKKKQGAPPSFFQTNPIDRQPRGSRNLRSARMRLRLASPSDSPTRDADRYSHSPLSFSRNSASSMNPNRPDSNSA